MTKDYKDHREMQVVLSCGTSTFLLIDHVTELVSTYQYPDYTYENSDTARNHQGDLFNK